MVLEFVLGFLLLVAASYIGTTMALRGFFGRERYESPFERGPGTGPRDGSSTGTGPGDGSLPDDDRHDDSPRADDVPRASDVTDKSGNVTDESDDVTDESEDE